jgi:hypothetical protein
MDFFYDLSWVQWAQHKPIGYSLTWLDKLLVIDYNHESLAVDMLIHQVL